MGKAFKKSEFEPFLNQSRQNETHESVWGHPTFLNQGATSNGFGSRFSSQQHQNSSWSQQNHQAMSNSSSNSRIHNNNVGTSRRNSKSEPSGNQTFDDVWSSAYGL